MKKIVSPELELLEHARQFDSNALASIYDTYSPGLYRYAMRLLGDADRAEECVAGTFERFLQALKGGGGPKNWLQAYLYRTAHNWIVDQYRREPVEPAELTEEQPDVAESPEEDAGRNIRLESLRSAMRRLTREQGQVIVLRYLEGWEYAEIARALGKPEGAVRSLHNRGLASLQRLLKSEETE